MDRNSEHHLEFCHFNIRSLLSDFNSFVDYVSDGLLDVIGLSETWLHQGVSSESVKISGYDFFRNDRDSRGGGVGFYIKNCLKPKLVDTADTRGGLEQLWVSIKLEGRRLCLGSLYRPPSANLVQCLDDLENIITEILPQYDFVIFGGDLNVDFLNLNSNSLNLLKVFLHKYNLEQIVTQATRVTDTSQTLIDLIVVTDISLINTTNNIDLENISDHCLVSCNLFLRKPKPDIKLRTYRDYSSFDYNNFLDDLYRMNWDNVYNKEHPDDIIYFLNEKLNSLFNVHIPLKTSRFTRAPAPWLTDNLKLMIKLRKKALSKYKKYKTESAKREYKELRNFVTMAVRNEKKAYLNSKLKSSPADFWRTTKYLNINPGHLDRVCNTLSPEVFNDFFVNGVPTVQSAYNQDIIDMYDGKLHPNVADVFEFSNVTQDTVERHLSRINTKARGVDGFDIKLISLLVPHLTPHITFLINRCLSSGTFPSLWKKANVVPIPKTNQAVNPCDYRPISILCPMSKILEKIVADQLSYHFNANRILPINQSAYRQGYSTTTALLSVSDDLLKAQDVGQSSCLVLLDYSKAFDTLCHGILLKKLKFFGLGDMATNFMNSYLSNRQQRVILDNKASNFLSTCKGVPQGSVLGPLLFSVYTSDFTNFLSKCQSHQYADDMQIYFSFPYTNRIEAAHIISKDLQSIARVSSAHKLILNSEKTKVVLFGKDKEKVGDDANFKIVMNGITLSYSNSCKNLGINMDNDMRFETHVAHLLKLSYFKLKTLYILKDLLSTDVRLQLCNSLVLSGLGYCDVLYWPALTLKNKISLQRLQNYCIKFCYNLRKYDHVTTLYTRSGWLNLDERFKLHFASLIFKIIRLQTPSYLFEKLIPRSDIHNRYTRHRGLYQVPRHGTAAFQRSFSYNAPHIFNSLPDHVKNCPSIATFKHRFRRYLLGTVD